MERPQGESEVAGGGAAGVTGGHLDEADRHVPPQLPVAVLVRRVRPAGWPSAQARQRDGAGVEPDPVGRKLGEEGERASGRLGAPDAPADDRGHGG